MRQPSLRKSARERAARGGGRVLTVQAGLPTPGPGDGEDWFGPSEPVSPVAPAQVAGRRDDYPVGFNLQIRPRAYEPVTFSELRALADGYDIMRLVIETIKDKVARQPWDIMPRDRKAKLEGELGARAQRIVSLLRRPDRDNFWNEWIRSVLEDLLVLDAPSVHVRRTLDNTEIYSLDQVDGATIKRIIDSHGRTPEPPYAAYQQVLKNLPAVNYSKRDLIYRPRNLRVNKQYGFSPVEQVIMTVNIAVRRQMWQLAYFTNGNIPDSLIGVPAAWTPDQIRAFQDYFDGILSGNTERRRGATFVPGEVAKSYVPTKEAEIFGGAEEWLARVVAFAFGVSPHWAIKGTNRAEAEVHQSEAEEDGLGPYKGWVKNLVDTIILDQFEDEELEFAWLDDEELDVKKKADVHKIYTDMGAINLDEVREDLGKDPVGGDHAIYTTTTQRIPVSLDEEVRRSKTKMEAMPPPDQQEDPDAPSDEDDDAEKLAKLAQADPAPLDRPLARRRMRAMRRTLTAALASLGDDVAGQVQRMLKAEGLAKSADHGDGVDNQDRMTAVTASALGAAEAEASALLAQSIVVRLDLSELDAIIDELGDDLEDVATDAGRLALQRVIGTGTLGGGGQTVAGIGVMDVNELFDRVNDRAVEYARQRAAELVGRRVLEDGSVIDNPNPRWAITQTTRDMVRDTIAGGLKNNIGSSAIVDELQDSFAFSASRAETISRTEIANANSEAAMVSYREAMSVGVQLGKEWLLGPNPCNTCIANAAQGEIPMDQAFQSGHMNTPAHPNCVCATVPVVRNTLGE